MPPEERIQSEGNNRWKFLEGNIWVLLNSNIFIFFLTFGFIGLGTFLYQMSETASKKEREIKEILESLDAELSTRAQEWRREINFIRMDEQIKEADEIVQKLTQASDAAETPKQVGLPQYSTTHVVGLMEKYIQTAKDSSQKDIRNSIHEINTEKTKWLNARAIIRNYNKTRGLSQNEIRDQIEFWQFANGPMSRWLSQAKGRAEPLDNIEFLKLILYILTTLLIVLMFSIVLLVFRYTNFKSERKLDNVKPLAISFQER